MIISKEVVFICFILWNRQLHLTNSVTTNILRRETMVFVVSRNSAMIFQLPRSPRLEEKTGSSAQSLTHHRPLYDEVSIFEVPELARPGEGIPHTQIILITWTMLEIPEDQPELREIFLPVSKLMISMTYMKDTRVASQQWDSLYYLECCSAPSRVLFPKSDASEKRTPRTLRTHIETIYSWPQKVTQTKPEMQL